GEPAWRSARTPHARRGSAPGGSTAVRTAPRSGRQPCRRRFYSPVGCRALLLRSPHATSPAQPRRVSRSRGSTIDCAATCLAQSQWTVGWHTACKRGAALENREELRDV